jgi:Fe-S-cluster-containing hydrogenase component 2
MILIGAGGDERLFQEKSLAMSIVRDPKACYGCRSCEIVCSYHHGGSFAPAGGAISVDKNNRTGKIRWRIDRTCDLCEKDGQPLCVQYCSYQALSFSPQRSLE